MVFVYIKPGLSIEQTGLFISFSLARKYIIVQVSIYTSSTASGPPSPSGEGFFISFSHSENISYLRSEYNIPYGQLSVYAPQAVFHFFMVSRASGSCSAYALSKLFTYPLYESERAPFIRLPQPTAAPASYTIFGKI